MVLSFLATTDVGWTSGPPAVDEDEDVASEASEWEAREQEERAWERREEERLGEGDWRGGFMFFLSFLTFIKFPLSFFCLHNHWFGKGMRGAEEATT